MNNPIRIAVAFVAAMLLVTGPMALASEARSTGPCSKVVGHKHRPPQCRPAVQPKPTVKVHTMTICIGPHMIEVTTITETWGWTLLDGKWIQDRYPKFTYSSVRKTVTEECDPVVYD